MATTGDPATSTARVTLLPGNGIVVRTASFLCVLGDRDAAAASDIRALDASVADGMREGRDVVGALAQLLSAADKPVAVAFAAADRVGISVYLSGAVFAEVDGRRLAPDGDTALERSIPWPIEGLGLYLDGAVPDEPGEERFDLAAGTVPAAGALLHTPPDLRGNIIQTDIDHTESNPTESNPTESDCTESDRTESDPTESDHTDSEAPPTAPEPAAAPTSVGDGYQPPDTEFVAVAARRTLVRGIRCPRGHLNHPRAWACAVCGLPTDRRTGMLTDGDRPPLGWLLLDNGSTFLLDEDLVIGREPTPDGNRRPVGPKPIRVVDETGQMSRRHIEIRLVDWSVHLVDLGSANGTFVTAPNTGNREYRIPAYRPHVLAPGSHVRVGGRHFVFESPHARN
ncbi:FHA domain-containing protein [Gordonia sp. NPDC003424]